MPEEESEAQSKIEQAKLICGRRVTGEVVRVRHGQAGSAIIDAARERKATAIVMQLRYRGGAPLYGRTLKTVLAGRPCRVLVVGAARRSAGPMHRFRPCDPAPRPRDGRT